MVHTLKILEASSNVSRLRSIASQIIACMSTYILLLDLGIAISFSTIALPDLLNAKKGLSLDDNQASWFGSITFLTQPIGAALSGPLVDYFGRKKGIFLVNIPHLVAWILFYFVWSHPSLLFASALLGFGTGIMEAPINSYVGEISEPSIRGSLCTLTQVFASLGTFAIFFLGTVVTWRVAALISLVFPIASMLLILTVPDTPIWLLSHGKDKEALRSLCYLRGWATVDQVQEELDQLSAYAKELQLCIICWNEEPNTKCCPHKDINPIKRYFMKMRYSMFCKETIRPFSMIMMYFLFYVISSTCPMRPNLVNFCAAFGMADDAKNIVMITGVVALATTVAIVFIIRLLGKRKLAIMGMFGTAVSLLALSIYAKEYLDDSVFTYNISTFPKDKSYVPLVFLYLLTLFTSFAIPWALLGEVFPFRSRASAQGLAAASNYIIMFIISKTYINLELGIQLWGTCLVYAIFGFLGVIYLYYFLPETEGKTLQEIESYYNGEFRIFADDPVTNYFKGLIKKI